MRALFILLLAIVLPLQMTWARVSDACLDHAVGHGHTQTHAPTHDHGHGHDTAQDGAKAAAETSTDDASPNAGECHDACHHFTAVVSSAAVLTQGPVPSRAAAAPRCMAVGEAAARPDRPQWLPLA